MMDNDYNEFVEYLVANKMAMNSIIAYTSAVALYQTMFGTWTSDNLDAFRNHLILNYKPQTVNLRILGINKYLEFKKLKDLRLNPIKIQQKTFTENVISTEDYERIKRGLWHDDNKLWYFMVWVMGATGARASELLQIRVEDVLNGHVDIISKGNKVRRLYFPSMLRADMMEWCSGEGIKAGFLFLNKRGKLISARGFAMQLKKLAKKYGIDTTVVHPHSFRHMFAKNFLARSNDISVLADLLGHQSIVTTQIYLRKTSREQRELIDLIVNW